ncbi:MAG TPA: M48 family metalloprotease, partial [Bacteroidota bacterium]|nr:M48 family metalloprotease [Bacteroidota bacterium]
MADPLESTFFLIPRILNLVTASPEITKRGIYAYEYEIVKDDSTINAFCTLGGYIYVYTCILKFVDNEAGLTGIIRHEIAPPRGAMPTEEPKETSLLASRYTDFKNKLP